VNALFSFPIFWILRTQDNHSHRSKEAVIMSTTGNEKNGRPTLKSRLQRYALFALAILSVILFLWIVVADMITTSRQNVELRALEQQHSEALDQRTRAVLHGSALVLQPALIQGLETNNNELLRANIQALMGRSETRLVIIADDRGMIRVSTDSRLEGTELQQTYQLVVGSITDITIDTTLGMYRILAPISKGGSRLGIAIAEFDFDTVD
jgi:sensor histidine kinase regulating citrate/malate metabolism